MKIDRAHLARQTMEDTALQKEILSIFSDQMTKQLAVLDPLSDDFASRVHSMKGSAKGVGSIVKAAETLEMTDADRLEKLKIFKLAVEEALVEVQEMLKP